MNKEKRLAILTRLRDNNPHPETELNFSSPFELLVAVTLSAQATDVSVNKATDKLFPIANTPEAIYALGVDGLKTYIKTIGLYNSKAENVNKACKMLIFPQTFFLIFKFFDEYQSYIVLRHLTNSQKLLRTFFDFKTNLEWRDTIANLINICVFLEPYLINRQITVTRLLSSIF